ncbi:serine protease snake isoform X2 [Aedes aegypti]|uniref:Uncharacterized protein n=1 Tax=Aedes aegypti TaxID=7159 RepID=A0A1S4FU45_AEDAE|nr:serine protease snake isoform X2 [Aedes aegypti]
MVARMLWLSCFVGLIACSLVQGKRISQLKCEEYVNQTMTSVSVISLILDPTPIEFTSYNCSKTIDLIVGGEDAKSGEFPHQGNNMNPAPEIVRFAELDLTIDEDEFDIEIEKITRHPAHRFRSSYHDIALVRLKEHLRFSAVVRPACLWVDVDTSPSPVIATGFGQLDVADERGSNTLRKVQLDVQDLSGCNNQFLGTRNFPNGMTDNQLCIGSSRGGKDTCQGDSGGPIQVLANPKWCIYHVLGVTSAGSACGTMVPAVYTKVASYIDWIEGIVWGSG